MKNINKKTILITLVVIFILALFVGLNSAKNLEIAKVKAELIEAKKPSLIEIQKKELDILEKSWQEAEKSCQKKLDIEPKIRTKRNEILGLKK